MTLRHGDKVRLVWGDGEVGTVDLESDFARRMGTDAGLVIVEWPGDTWTPEHGNDLELVEVTS